MSEPINTNTNPIEEQNNRILSDQSNNMNTNSQFTYKGKPYKTASAMKGAMTKDKKNKIKI